MNPICNFSTSGPFSGSREDFNSEVRMYYFVEFQLLNQFVKKTLRLKSI
jgi:hypothetical protein